MADEQSTQTPPSAGDPPAGAPPVGDPPPSDTKQTAPPDPPPAKVVTKPADPPPPPPDPTTYTLPEGFKLNDAAKGKLDAFLKGHVKDGKLDISAQDVIAHYHEQASDANKAWQESQKAQNAAWEAECKTLFTPEELASAEVGVGFFASFDLDWRKFSASMRNHPSFVNAMKIVGESLAEDGLHGSRGAQPQKARRNPADVLYDHPSNKVN